MSGEISIAKAKAGFAALVARAEAGEQIVVTRNGWPVACLGPLPAKKPIVYGDLAHLWLADDLSLPEDIIDDFYKSGGDPERGSLSAQRRLSKTGAIVSASPR